MKTWVVTGGIGSGKSVVSRLLEERGVPVYDADSRTKALYDGPLLERIEAAFGCSFGRPVDYAALGRAAFASPESLSLLESLVHPAVLEDFTAWRSRCGEVPFVVLESAIILGKPLFDGCYDGVVLVYAPVEQRLERVLRRNPSLSEEDVLRRMASQSFDFGRADYLIINDSTLDALSGQVDALYEALR